MSSVGPYVERFETEWAAICDRRYGISVSNGTVALQLAVAVAELPPGSEIIMPTFTIISCALAALYNDCVPVVVDSDPRTGCIDADLVASRITERTRAIMPVHIYGHPADMDPILDLAGAHDLIVIEDAAEAHGAEYKSRDGWRICGSMGQLSAFSFYANKLITTGEGGMIVTDDERLADRARSLRNLAFQPERRFVHEQLGFNFRLTNLQAALGVAQLQRWDEIVAKKRWIGSTYNELLADVSGVSLPVEEPYAQSVYWMYGIVLDDNLPLEADAVQAALHARGVDTRPFFVGMHEQPALLRRGLFEGERYLIAEKLSRRGFYLPSGLSLTGDQIAQVADALREVLST